MDINAGLLQAQILSESGFTGCEDLQDWPNKTIIQKIL